MHIGPGGSGIRVFDRKRVNGELVEIQTHRGGFGGVDGIGAWLERIAILSRDSLTVLLTQVGIVRDGIDVDGLLASTATVVPPDGRYLFATCSGVLADENCVYNESAWRLD